MLARAKENKVEKIVCIGTSNEDSLAARDFAESHDDVYWTYGIHPENATTDSELEFSRSFATTGAIKRAKPVTTGLSEADRENSNQNTSKLVAIGEVGLDYHYEGYDKNAQIKLFREMLDLAKENDLPVVFHVREAFDDFFKIVKEYPEVRGIVHSFTDSKKVLKRIIEETDFYVGVNGLATYSTLPTPPLERIVLETDAPFLTPVPFRGIINECAYVRCTAEWLAAKLGVDIDTIERETTKNAKRLYRI